jgi:predicted HicB family RNase H-like nuclease
MTDNSSMDEFTVLTVRRVPKELGRQAKSIAALKGQSLQEFVIEAIRKAVESEGKSKGTAKK